MSSEQRLPLLISLRQLDPEDAETHNVASLERRRSPPESSDQQQQQLHRMHDLLSPPEEKASTAKAPLGRFADAARRVSLLQKLAATRHHHQQQASSTGARGSPGKGHRKSVTADIVLGRIGIGSSGEPMTSLLEENRHISKEDAIYRRAAGIDSDSESEKEEEKEEEDHEETLPLTSQYGSLAAEFRSIKIPAWKRCFRQASAQCCNPRHVCTRFYEVVICSFFFTIAMPLFIVAGILYYSGNPDFDFVPGRARLSWWLNFFGRQIITLEFARITQWLVLDCFLLGTRFAARVFGPLVTMTALQSRGWPFVVALWAVWNLFLLHGNNKFQVHWFYWTGLKIYSVANSGAYIQSSVGYFRVLLAMIVAGVATTFKRMFLTIRFGRRVFADFKPRLVRLLADMVLVSDIADLALRLEQVSKSFEDNGDDNSKEPLNSTSTKGTPRGAMDWTAGVTFEDNDDDAMNGPGVAETEQEKSARRSSIGERRLIRSASGSFTIKSQLDRWDEPVGKDKTNEASIQEVLKFKHALNCMDEIFPFGSSFGQAQNRNECIANSHNIYCKLLKCLPGSHDLSFDILALIATDDNGVEDEAKMKALRKLFQPDAKNELPLLAFVQSCDTVYKRLRYFMASVSNASVIDNALEGILNYFYWIVLSLLLLSIMQFNPWPLLVSITSLLVSVSFALGSSVSKYVEGILLIAIRRPFDLGDRIVIIGAESVDSPGPSASWFVEDISLFFTTLRFARTNEVSTVNNFSISQSRIVNLQRSMNAIVFVELRLSISILGSDKLDKFREALETHVRDQPRIWDSLAFCRHDFFDADMEFVMFTLAFRHRLSWQYASRININRADLLRFIYELSMKLGINYDTPPPRRILIQAQPPPKFDSSMDLYAPPSLPETGLSESQQEQRSFGRDLGNGSDALIGTGPLD